MTYEEKKQRFAKLPPGYKPELIEAGDLLWLYTELQWAWKSLEAFADAKIPANHSDCVMLLDELRARAIQVLGVEK